MRLSLERSAFENQHYSVTFILFFGLLSLFSVKINHLGTILSIVEFAIIWFYIVTKKPISAFISYLIFNAVSFEIDAFLYLSDTPPFQRHSFFLTPVFGVIPYVLTIIVLFFQVRSKYGIPIREREAKRFYFWLIILLVTGAIQGLICDLVNDNNVRGSSSYPTVTVIETIRFAALASFIGIGIMASQVKQFRFLFVKCCKDILFGIGIIALVSVGMGYEGVSANDTGRLLAPLASLFVPFLLTYLYTETGVSIKNRGENYVLSFIAIGLIIVSVFRPNVMGSKWYLVLGGVLFVLVTYIIHIKHYLSYFVLALFALFLISTFSDLLLSAFSNSEFNEWKFGQTVNAINIFSYNSINEWFLNLAPSPAFRIDEVLNIGIEYTDKPFYSMLGKGFGGTTLHHTPFLFWEKGDGTFSDEQIRLGAYYAMHESVPVIFLRHGLVGVLFMLQTLIVLLKRMPKTRWALLGIIWFFFFWRYGVSFWIGALALCLALTHSTEERRE